MELKSMGGHKKGRLKVEALVLPNISLELPLQQFAFDPRWKHLRGLNLADPDLGVPGRVDVLIGADVYCRTVLLGQWFSPSGSPMAIKTRFGWVLSGPTLGKCTSGQDLRCLSLTSCDEQFK